MKQNQFKVRQHTSTRRRLTAAAAASTIALTTAIAVAPASVAADLTVTTSSELVAAIHQANSTIELDTIIVQGQINLTQDLPDITESLVIRGENGSIDGGNEFMGISANEIASLDVEGLALTNFVGSAIEVFDVDDVTITDTIIDTATRWGLYAYLVGTNSITITDTHVSNTQDDGVWLRLFHNTTAHVDGLHVEDSGRIEGTTIEREHGGLAVKAEHNSQATLTNISYVETDPTRNPGYGFSGITAYAGDQANISIFQALTDGSENGLQLSASMSGSVTVDDLVMENSSEQSLDAWAENDGEISVSNFTVRDGGIFATLLQDNASITVERGIIQSSNAPLPIGFASLSGESEDLGANRTNVSVTDVVVLDSHGPGISIVGIANISLDSVTVARSSGMGLAIVQDVNDTALSITNSTITENEFGSLVVLSTEGSTLFVDIESSTLADNGDQEFFLEQMGGHLELSVRNSIVSGALDSSVTPALLESLTSTYSLWNGVDVELAQFLNESDTGNIVNIDPQLEALADNGGHTPTRLPSADSPVIDAGDPQAVQYSPALDQRHQTRILGMIDLGATEVGTLDEENDDETPGEDPGDEEPGDQEPGDQEPGDQEPGDQEPGDQEPGDQEPGDQEPGDQEPGDDQSGDDNASAGNAGADNGLADTGASVSLWITGSALALLVLGALTMLFVRANNRKTGSLPA